MVGLYLPGLARRGVAVLRLRGVLGEASACRLAAALRCAFAADPDLLITDVGRLRGMRGCRPYGPGGAELLRHACRRLPSRPGQITAATQWAGAILGAWDLPGNADAALAGLSELAATWRMPHAVLRAQPGTATRW